MITTSKGLSNLLRTVLGFATPASFIFGLVCASVWPLQNQTRNRETSADALRALRSLWIIGFVSVGSRRALLRPRAEALWAPSFIGLVVAAGDVALSRVYGEAAPLGVGGLFGGGGRHFRVRSFRGGSGRRPRLDRSARRLVGRVHIEPVFDFTSIFESELAAFHAGVRDLSGRICAFEGLSRELIGQQQCRNRQDQFCDLIHRGLATG